MKNTYSFKAVSVITYLIRIMEFNIFITGDYCPIGRNKDAIQNNDFSFISEIKPYSKAADLSITNLEAPITEYNNKILKSGPNIKASKSSLNVLKDAGFNLVALANNHILDFGEKGVKDTLDNCHELGIKTVGAGANLKAARELNVQIIRNKSIGFLNFAENEFCAATDLTFGANPVQLIDNFRDIKKAKLSVDYLIVIVHGGREHYQLPTPSQKNRYRFYAESGADIVVGHHPHCYSGYETYEGTPIFYSLGNFIFDYKEKYQKGKWTEGYAVNFNFSDEEIKFELIPFYQGRKTNQNLVLFSAEEKVNFFERIACLNDIITDEIKFKNEWKNYIKTQKKTYKGMLMLQNKYVRAAISRGLLPEIYFHSNSHKTLLLNLLRCESHREIMIKILEKDIY